MTPKAAHGGLTCWGEIRLAPSLAHRSVPTTSVRGGERVCQTRLPRARESRSVAADRTIADIPAQYAATFRDHNNIDSLCRNRRAVRRPARLTTIAGHWIARLAKTYSSQSSSTRALLLLRWPQRIRLPSLVMKVCCVNAAPILRVGLKTGRDRVVKGGSTRSS